MTGVLGVAPGVRTVVMMSAATGLLGVFSMALVCEIWAPGGQLLEGPLIVFWQGMEEGAACRVDVFQDG